MGRTLPARRSARKAQTRALLVTTAAALFRAHGYEAVTVRDIARGAGLSTGALFNCFTGKRDLLDAVLAGYAPPVRAAHALRVFGFTAEAEAVEALRSAGQ